MWKNKKTESSLLFEKLLKGTEVDSVITTQMNCWKRQEGFRGWAKFKDNEYKGEKRAQGQSIWWFLDEFNSERVVLLSLFNSCSVSPILLPSQLCLSQMGELHLSSHGNCVHNLWSWKGERGILREDELVALMWLPAPNSIPSAQKLEAGYSKQTPYPWKNRESYDSLFTLGNQHHKRKATQSKTEKPATKEVELLEQTEEDHKNNCYPQRYKWRHIHCASLASLVSGLRNKLLLMLKRNLSRVYDEAHRMNMRLETQD